MRKYFRGNGVYDGRVTAVDGNTVRLVWLTEVSTPRAPRPRAAAPVARGFADRFCSGFRGDASARVDTTAECSASTAERAVGAGALSQR